MKRTFSMLAAVVAVAPLIAEARSSSYDAGYAVGSYVAWVIDRYGPYLLLAALAIAVCGIWSLRVMMRRRRGGEARRGMNS